MNKMVVDIARAIKEAGGRALVVGGYVRDHILNRQSNDVDIEVYKLPIDNLELILKQFGDVHAVGKSFGVLKLDGMDISVPRRDSKIGKGHTGFRIDTDPNMSIEDAARRRDFTMNSMSIDPITGELLDPYGGREDLMSGILRMTDPTTFIEDPLRVLRAAQFISRFELAPDQELLETSRDIAATLNELAAERIWEEMVKLLLKGNKPSKGFYFLNLVDAVKTLFPEMHALIDCQQDTEWHPEGDVWIHTLMVIDAAAEMRTGDPAHDLQLMFGSLCHDFGKPPTTKFEDGRWRARGHEDGGIVPATSFMERLRAPLELVAQVNALVAHHLAPAHFAAPKMMATPKAYRNLARKMADAGTTIDMLHKVATSDHFGRTTPDAVAREFPAGDIFLAKAKEIKIEVKPEEDVVMGRHLIAKGMAPSKEFGPILVKCREVQYETGLKDADTILKMVLG